MSASSKRNRPDPPTPTGDCFEAVIKFIEDPTVLEFPDDYRVVHGNVAALRQDEAVNHAWIEEGDEVIHEVSGGRKNVIFKDAYYQKHQVTNVRRYTVAEALSLCVKTPRRPPKLPQLWPPQIPPPEPA